MSQIANPKASKTESHKSRQIQNHEAVHTLVHEKLNNFHVIRNHFLQVTISLLPIFLVFMLLSDWLVGQNMIVSDLFRLTGIIGAIAQLLVINVLFAKIPGLLISIWSHSLAKISDTSRDTQIKFLEFIHDFESALNHRLSIVLGIIFATSALFSTYPVRILFSTGRLPYNLGQFIAVPIGGVIIFEVIIASILGLMFWRFCVIAFFITQLSRQFELSIQPGHIDKSGGLKPLGDVCLTNALFILVPAIALSIWVIAPTHPGFTGYVLWSGVFRVWLLILIVLSMLTFFLPLYSIHIQMTQQQRKIQFELSEVSQKIVAIQQELRAKADTFTADEGTDRLKTLDFLEKVYALSTQSPTWPFDWNIFVKFIIAEAVPILSLMGFAEPVITIFSKLAQSLPTF